MTAHRSRISAELMEALQLLKFSIHQERGLNFTSGFDWAEELDELESLADLHKGTPEDIPLFINSLVNA